MAIILNSVLPPEDNTPEQRNLKPLDETEGVTPSHIDEDK